MTHDGTPYPAGGYGGSAPYGPPGGQSYGPPGGPVAGARPAAALWPIVLLTVFFALFGLIPTILASNKASHQRQPTSRYWVAFLMSLLASVVLYTILVVVLVVFVLAGTVAVVDAAANAIPSVGQQFGSDYPTASTSAGSAPVAGAPTTGPCAYTPAASGATAATLPDDPATTPTATRTWTLVTSAGTIVMILDGAAAPCTVQSIVHLTELGFYDSTECPRSVDQVLFVLQCGDPSGTGAGGPGYTFADENLAAANYTRGTVAMANSGPDTNGSQFFLIDKDANAALPNSYTVFGKITAGLDILDKIVASGNDASRGAGDGTPTPAVTIETATIR